MARVKLLISTALLTLSLTAATGVSAKGLDYVETASGTRSANARELVRWTHARLVFNKDLKRVAVGQNRVMEVELLGGREALLLGKEVGRTSLIVWYVDGTTETFLFSVIEDLTVLRRALRDIHENIRIELAPDRAALVLRGTVPTMKYKVAAETAARSYLDAGSSAARGASGSVVLEAGKAGGNDKLRVTPAQAGARSPSATAMINLIKVEQLPETLEQKIREAIRDIGGQDVRVRRVSHGDLPDDQHDTLILEGQVQNQVDLVRVLNVAARLFVGTDGKVDIGDTIDAVADEAGGLIGKADTNKGSTGGGGSSLLGGQGGSANLENNIKANVGRAKLLSVAGGRVLSLIEVRDIPQVRVAVQMYEVNRSRLKNWRPNMTLVSGDYVGTSYSPAGTGMIVQPDAAQRIGSGGNGREVEDALQVLGGALTNHFQIGASNLAFDLLFSLLEQEGIARTLSRPTLTVLSGEPAVFQVGGEVPVPTSFAPAFGGAADAAGAPGVFTGTEFRPFGIQLNVRPMVGDDDRVTLDVRPSVVVPDSTLTQQIAVTTGSPLTTTAFNTRGLETTTRMRDGQPLVIGGLISRRLGEDKGYTPGVHQIPILGWLAKSDAKLDDDRELVIVVTPSVVREPKEDIALWQFPTAYELLTRAVGEPDPTALPSELDPRKAWVGQGNEKGGDL